MLYCSQSYEKMHIVKPSELLWHCSVLGKIALPKQLEYYLSGCVQPVLHWKTEKRRGRAGEQCQAYAINLHRVNQRLSLWCLKPRVKKRKEQQNFYECEPHLSRGKKKKRTWRGGTGKSWRQGLYRVNKHKELWLVKPTCFVTHVWQFLKSYKGIGKEEGTRNFQIKS